MSGGRLCTAVLSFFIGFDRFPHALKTPAAQRRNSSHPETATLHFTLNQDNATVAHRAHDRESIRTSCVEASAESVTERVYHTLKELQG